AGPERRHAGAIEIFVVVVARGVVLPPATAADAEVLVLGELLAGGELRCRRYGARVEAGRAERGEAGGGAQEIAAPGARGGEPLGKQVHLRVGNRGSLHGILHSLFHFWVESVADAIAEEREREHGDRDGDRRKHAEMPVRADVLLAFADHLSPRRRGRVDADADERQRRL